MKNKVTGIGLIIEEKVSVLRSNNVLRLYKASRINKMTSRDFTACVVKRVAITISLRLATRMRLEIKLVVSSHLVEYLLDGFEFEFLTNYTKCEIAPEIMDLNNER